MIYDGINYGNLIYMNMYLKIEVFEQIYRFRGLIYYGKTMVLHVYGKNYGAIEKPMVLWKNLWCYTENYN